MARIDGVREVGCCQEENDADDGYVWRRSARRPMNSRNSTVSP